MSIYFIGSRNKQNKNRTKYYEQMAKYLDKKI